MRMRVARPFWVVGSGGVAGDVDILVDNAGIFSFAPTHEINAGDFDATFATNVRGPFFSTAAVAPKMAARGHGAIVNIANPTRADVAAFEVVARVSAECSQQVRA
jgi:NAD(P)-dependent dehydrogenase (short-subunit alcohol dehydrogenase family)